MDKEKLEKEINSTTENIARAKKILEDVKWEIEINEFMLKNMKELQEN